ncbi:MAG: transglutaminase domain-containing protein [Pirellulales bacterium]
MFAMISMFARFVVSGISTPNATRAMFAMCLAQAILFASAADVLAQRKTAKERAKEEAAEELPKHIELTAPRIIEMQVGVRILAGDSNMAGTIATTVFPTNWPEQKVEIIGVNMPAPLSHSLRDLPGNNQQLLMKAAVIPAGVEVQGVVTVRIEKKHIVGPSDTSIFVIPKRVPSDFRPYMGNSPYIETNSNQISKIAKDIAAQNPENAWKQVEMIYDWVRENITYQRGKIKDTKETLKDKSGDCEEMTSLFIAICRNSKIPARCVWIPNHCYPEFYLEDEEGNGTWFPCQVAGSRSFGSMAEYLPVLQKGDRFNVPEKKETQRYLADYLTSQKISGSRQPRVNFIRQLLGDAANLKAGDPGNLAADGQMPGPGNLPQPNAPLPGAQLPNVPMPNAPLPNAPVPGGDGAAQPAANPEPATGKTEPEPKEDLSSPAAAVQPE